MSNPAVLAIDLGTSALKVSYSSKETQETTTVPYPTYHPHLSLLEQEPQDWIAALLQAMKTLHVKQNIKPDLIGICGHMSAPVFMAAQGRVLGKVQLLADHRCKKEVKQLEQDSQDFVKICGNAPSTVFALPKILWQKTHHQDLFQKIQKILFPKDYLRFWLTGDQATDPSDAGNSLLYDYHQGTWNDDLAEQWNIETSLLPTIKPSLEIAGTLKQKSATALGLLAGTPVMTGCGDLAAAHYVTHSLTNDTVSVVLGSSAVVMSQVSQLQPIQGLTFHPSCVPQKFFGVGSHFNGSACLNWFSRFLNNQQTLDYNHLEDLAREAEKTAIGSNGLLFIPHMAGAGSPSFNPDAKSVLWGLKHSTSQADVFRALIEGVSYNLNQTLQNMRKFGMQLKKIALMGGGAKLKLWRQILSNVSGLPLQIGKQTEMTLQGINLAAYQVLQAEPEQELWEEDIYLPNLANYQHYQKLQKNYEQLEQACFQFSFT